MRCKRCVGTGKIRVLGQDFDCPVCKGLKQVVVPKGKDICDDCKGSGEKYTLTGEKIPCLACDGTGFVPDPNAKKED